MKTYLEWNLCFPEGHMLNKEEIVAVPFFSINYPIQLEEEARQAVLKKDGIKLKQSYQDLVLYLQKNQCHPRQIKEILIRFNWNMANVRRMRKEETDLQVHHILQNMVTAVTWREIQKNIEMLIDLIYESPKPDDNSVSEMVQKAKELVQNYYSQGITLEETARKLFVSEEYLSTQFKKETGASFTETVRKYRIEKVKRLLLDTTLKLNQIAELAGYSDPKYMSRVFKEEVGMFSGRVSKVIH